MKGARITVWIALLLLFSISVSALENSMTILAVRENGNGSLVGGTAELTVEIKEGKGRVFVETSPLTKIDTQVSTRFAQQIACSSLNYDCSNLDFIYTIRSDAPIVGGPSAGAAMAVLTAITLENTEYDEAASITGTINSGGIIGPVGGVIPKIGAAKDKGITKVLVPMGEIANGTLSFNETENIAIEDFEIEVIEVGTLNDAYFEFTGKYLFPKLNDSLSIDEDYAQIMRNVSDDLCKRTKELINLTGSNSSLEESEKLMIEGNYYSAASKCFSLNIQLTNRLNQNLSADEIEDRLDSLQRSLNAYNVNVETRIINSVPELQTYMIVKERISESKERIESSKNAILLNQTSLAIEEYSYAKERYYSAISWSNFFAKDGKQINISSNILRSSCIQKIQEADERLQYVASIFPVSPNDLFKQVNKAKKELERQEYALCLNTASLAKADADAIISSSGTISEEVLREIIDLKLGVARENIIKEQNRGFFPIAGYSYYEYANNLKNQSVLSSMVYSQYALELSSFDVYFNEGKEYYLEDIPDIQNQDANYEMVLIYAIGIITGVVVTYMVLGKNF